jgi:ADP-heptose:LPS heptosyltransferase
MLAFWLNVFFARLGKNNSYSSEKSLAIVYYGLIGDYIIFRNFLEALKKSEKYKDYKITLIGNNCFKSLALSLDAQFVDSFIWIDHKKLSKNIFYRYKTFVQLSKLHFSELIVPTDSRSILHTDLLALAINADKKTTMVDCGRNIGNHSWGQKQRQISDKWYNELLPVDYSNDKCEFCINRQIFEKVTKEKYFFEKPQIILPDSLKLSDNVVLPPKYIVFAVGGSIKGKKWPASHFAELAKNILANSDYKIVFCGDKNDAKESSEIKYQLSDTDRARTIDLCGKTSLTELMLILNNSSLLVAGESSAVHMAVALEANGAKNEIFVLFANRTYGRFAPYPESITQKYHLMAHPSIERNEDGNPKIEIFENNEMLPIKDITPERVFEKVSEYLKL